MLSVSGLIIGISSLAVLLFCVAFGFHNFYHAKKMNADLLYLTGIIIICTGGFYLGVSVDFLLVIFTGENLVNFNGLHGVLGFMWTAPAIVSGMYLGATLIVPRAKKSIAIIYLTLAILFEFFLFVNPIETFIFNYPPINGSELIDTNIVFGHPTFILIAIFLVSTLLFNGVGFLVKSRKTSGDLRRNFLYVGIGFIIFVGAAALDALIAPGPLVLIARFGMISYALLMFSGLEPMWTHQITHKSKKEESKETKIMETESIEAESIEAESKL
ncbi:MAG: conserved membrane protein of unknown function [Promethearchaeota archaeon]|nr:MAG: conserved membrane protein of unknown function [Candidatus Lokiarchaeota archaeon]